ncbi:LytR/AlgR family response regulator transcription factor [Tepidibacter mesophilus]|uniref:LytR/AlgR family response regulator transcription factor n=1 Tax=Tepidibacter mesophilus TaxID=655607 RepID=UPI000C071F4A|nr:LytTR family DNA-binding domain-containing protein [Tepidibacter mesophilus]
MNIIICEDNQIIAEGIADTINKLNSTDKYNFEIDMIKDSDEGVIEYVRNNNDKEYIYILDIGLRNNRNGIELAREIRRYDDKGEIIFITGYSHMMGMLFKYRVRAIDFIDKGSIDVYDRLSETLKNIYDRNNMHNLEESMILKNGFNEYIIKLSDIINIETVGKNRKIIIYTKDGIYEFAKTLKDIEVHLDDRFFRSHRSCILNKDYVKRINTKLCDLYVLMENGQKSLLSRNKIRELKYELHLDEESCCSQQCSL